MDAAVVSWQLTKHYPMGGGVVRALDGVPFSVGRRESVGLPA